MLTTHTDAGHINGYDPACEACNPATPAVDIIARANRLTSAQIRAVTTIAESWGWTDITSHYGDPDCDLTQTFERGEIYVQITWKGDGVHRHILTVETHTRAALATTRPDGLLFYSALGGQRDLMGAVKHALTTA